MEQPKVTIQQIVEILREIQRESGEEDVEISEETCPHTDLPGFDSPRGVEAIVKLEGLLDMEIEGDVNPFVSSDGMTLLTVREATDKLNSSKSGKRRQ